ncbi:MAG: ATP-binding protein, partial [Bacteroidota bacterium]|nr:ATP-binding protein [Bacteroidota bacterium]
CRTSDSILWVGTNGKGLSYHHPGTNIFDVYSKSKPASNQLDFESVRSVYTDDDWIFVGGYFGLNRINRKTGKRDYLIKTWVPYSFCEVEGDPNLLLIGTEGISLLLINKQNGFVRPIEMEDIYYDEKMLNLLDFVYCMIHYQGSQYLIGYSGGLALIDIDNKKILQNYSSSDDPNSIVSGEIKSLLRDSEGQIWVGSVSGGLAKFLPKQGIFIRINSKNGFKELPSNVILDLHQDLAGNIWVATSMGLCKFNGKTGLERVFSVSDGLPSDLIYAIEEGQANKLWCSNSDGLSRIDTKTGNILNFNSRHGLPGNELNRGASFKGKDGIMYFGGIDGLVSFSSNQAMIEFPKPKPQIVKFFLYNKEAKLDTLFPYAKEVVIRPGQKYFSFEVTGTDYILDEENYFQYNIPEILDTWIDIQGARRISITDPDPGTYHLSVRVSNDQQTWVEMENPLIIRVLPKIHQTTAAKILALLFAVSMLILGVFLRTRYLIRKQAELNRLVDLRTSELRKSERQLREANASKDRFFSIIAHDLKSPFNSLLGLSELLSEEWDEYSDKEKQRMIGMIQGNLSSTYKLLINLLDWSRLQRETISADIKDTDLRKLSENTVDGFQVQIASKRIVVSNQIESDHIAMADPFMVETIYRNLIFNAIKFTPAEGQITLTTKLENDQIKCCISDTGIGMNAEMQKGLFKLDESQSRPGTEGEKGTGLGLLVCKEFIHLMGGKMEVTSREGEGSTFCFLLSQKH